jgi:DNA-binding CsgD family transcriptional regulator
MPGSGPQRREGREAVAPKPVPLAFDDWLTSATVQQPVVLSVDDLQWADEATLDVLMYVLAGPVHRHLSVLLTIRSSEVGPDHPLRRWLADARRLPGVTELVVGPLSRQETAEQVADVLGSRPHTSLADQVHARSGGNPYLARLLVTGLDAGARQLPAGLPEQLTAAVIRPYFALSPRAKRLITTIAVGGRPLSGAAAERTADIADISDPTPALREAVDAGLLERSSDGSLWFRHPLQAQALEQGLLPQEQRALHARFAASYALQAVENDDAAELSEAVCDHHILADNPHEALTWALAAAAAREKDGDRVGLLRMMRRAARLRDQLAEGPDTLSDLLDRVRDLAEEVADWGAELEAIEGLLSDGGRADIPVERVFLAARRAELRFTSGKATTSAELRRFVELGESEPQSWQTTYATGIFARMLLWEGDMETASSVLEDALSECLEGSSTHHELDVTGHTRARATVLTTATMLAVFRGQGATARRLGRAGRAAAQECGDAGTAVWAAIWEAFAHDSDLSRVWVELVERQRADLEARGAPHAHIAWLSAAEANTWLLIGEPGRCRDRLRVALGADPGPFGDFLARITAAMLATWQGRQDEAEAHLSRAEELIPDPASFPNFSFDVARATVRLGAADSEGAREAALKGLSTTGVPPSSCEFLLPLASRALADMVEAERDGGENPSRTLAEVDALVTTYPHALPHVGLQSRQYRRQLAAIDALYAAEVARARADPEAGRAWAKSVELLAGSGLPWHESYACWRTAQTLLRSRPAGVERREAAKMLRRGHETARRLGCTPVQNNIEALARAARISLSSVAATRCTADAGDRLSMLTKREREVLAHVVAGRTYAEIASDLFLSEKTVSTHITNILRKSGTANRVELADWAQRGRGVGP